MRRRKTAYALLVFILALPLLLPVFTFPKPTGSKQVGVMKLHLTDSQRNEIIPGYENKKRELMLSVWYPAEQAPGASYRTWTFHDIMDQIMKADGFPPFTYDYFKYVKTNSVEQASPAISSAGAPVVLFLHGFPGMSTQSIPLVEELASHGYVVAAPDFTYVSAAPEFPDGTVVEMEKGLLELSKPQLNSILNYWVQDISFIIDELEGINLASGHPLSGKLNLQQIGVVGHSFGGSTALHALLADPRIDSAISMDSPSYGAMDQGMKLTKPFLIMDASESDWDTNVKKNIFEQSSADGYMMTLQGADHDSFTNYPLESPLFASLFINKYKAHRLINDYSLAFLNRHLLGKEEDLLQLAAHDKEIAFQQNNP
nr:alpha/beta fold hydrolase [Paenibacillus turpanensis]